MNFSAVGGGGGFICGVHDVSGYVVDDAEDGMAGVEEADADGEGSEAGDEIVGAVDGVDDPVSAGGVVDVGGD